MKDFIQNSVFFGVTISLLSYGLGVWLKKKFKVALINPLLISVIITTAVLLLLKIDYGVYEKGASILTYMLTPATVCLAIPVYEQLEILKKNKGAILIGVASGVVTSLLLTLILAIVFKIGHSNYVTLLPKSVTTAIGMEISAGLSGYVPLTVAAIVITGILGNVIGELVFKLFRITHPIAKGIGLGTASHVVGTAKAVELGEVEGAMSSLSVVVAGMMTVVAAIGFSYFY